MYKVLLTPYKRSYSFGGGDGGGEREASGEQEEGWSGGSVFGMKKEFKKKRTKKKQLESGAEVQERYWWFPEKVWWQWRLEWYSGTHHSEILASALGRKEGCGWALKLAWSSVQCNVSHCSHCLQRWEWPLQCPVSKVIVCMGRGLVCCLFSALCSLYQ